MRFLIALGQRWYDIARRRKTPKYDHAKIVNSLFDKIITAAPATAVNAAWLEATKQAALRKSSGWKASVDAFLRGLGGAGCLSGIELVELRASIAQCTDSAWPEFIYLMVWTPCVVLVTLAVQTISIDWLLAAAILYTTATASALWVWNRARLKLENSAKQARCDRILAMLDGALWVTGVTVGAVFIAALLGPKMQSLSIYRFNADRMAFAADPQGFPFLRAFARKNFDVDVVLGDATDSWALTTLRLPGASVASMSSSLGYCKLSMYRDNVLRSFKPRGKTNQVLWLQGVMMHEFGHCLDTRRDLPGFGQHTVKAHSIAPIDAKGVSDLQTYLAATKEDSTKIWREALADIFAVGYWRLAAPSDAAGLATSLRQRRSNAADDDSIHATMCWIDQAMQAPAPVSEKDLFTWADHQRSVASCAISKSSKTQ